MVWTGPGSPFAVLWQQDGQEGNPLPTEVEPHYGQWLLPVPEGRPFIYANFVISHDGRISYQIPGAAGGGEISGFNRHDAWLMGLLRARADAVVVGENTLRSEPAHIWTPEYIFPPEAQAYAALRAAEGRQPMPLQVFVSLSGNVEAGAEVFGHRELTCVVCTTERGAEQARRVLSNHPWVTVLAFGEETVDLEAMAGTLRERYAVRSVLCEGGPTLYGAMVGSGLVDQEFLTLSPIIAGNNAAEGHRPGLIEGNAYLPETSPRTALLAVRMAGTHLFLQSRLRHSV